MKAESSALIAIQRFWKSLKEFSHHYIYACTHLCFYFPEMSFTSCTSIQSWLIQPKPESIYLSYSDTIDLNGAS